jgi:hypothetical protein
MTNINDGRTSSAPEIEKQSRLETEPKKGPHPKPCVDLIPKSDPGSGFNTKWSSASPSMMSTTLNSSTADIMRVVDGQPPVNGKLWEMEASFKNHNGKKLFISIKKS